MTEFVTDTIWGMYPIFLDAGYSPQLFWELSVGEVNDLLESYARRKELEQKQREAMRKQAAMERGEDSGGDDAGKAPGDHRGPDKGLLRGAKESTAADAESD